MDTLRTQSGLPPDRIKFLDETVKTIRNYDPKFYDQKFYIVLNEIPVKIDQEVAMKQLEKFKKMENVEILFNSDWLGRFL